MSPPSAALGPGASLRESAAGARYDRVVVVAVLLIAGAAWVVVAGTHVDLASGPSMHHAGAGYVHGATLVDQSVGRLTGWTVMVLAMMLPPALPLVQMLRMVTARRRRSSALTLVGSAAFTLPWIAAGTLLIAADLTVGRVNPTGPWLTLHPQVTAGVAAVAAGTYQFTPVKRACLAACRSPRQLALTQWHGVNPARDVVGMGLRYGVVCVGCCWALMLLTLAVGWAIMPVMVVLSAVMAAERLLPRVRPLVPCIAVASVALGIALLTGIVPAGHIIGGLS